MLVDEKRGVREREDVVVFWLPAGTNGWTEALVTEVGKLGGQWQVRGVITGWRWKVRLSLGWK